MCFLYEIEGNKVELYSNGQEEIVSSIETFKEMRPLLEEFKPPWHHSASIFHGFKDPFMREESARDESFQVFNFISPTIGTWMQQKHDPSLSYRNYDEDLRGRSRFWDHIFPQAEFTRDGIVHDLIDRNSRTSYFEEGGTDLGSQYSGSKRFALVN